MTEVVAESGCERQAAIESSFLDFARARTVGSNRAAAMRSGRFSVVPGATEPEFFGAVDMVYAAHILGVLDEMLDGGSGGPWIDLILSFQSEDGWFRSGDRQSHGVEHATAYALGALQILGTRAPALKPLEGFKAQVAARPGADTAPFRLSLLDRTHFWRGSHRAGGLAAIVGSVHELGCPTESLLGIEDARGWLEGWWAWFEPRIDPGSGYWRLASPLLHACFDMLYRRRHDPTLASMGGAVHLYWVSERLGKRFPHPEQTVAKTARLLPPSGLYEHEPYCIDLDGAFMIGRALAGLPATNPVTKIGTEALRRNREAILDWFFARTQDRWNESSHKLPGAFAAVAEADRVLAPPGQRRWRDVFETCWWL